MDDDTHEMVRRLFATATALLEDATPVAIAGQSPRASKAQLAVYARRLESAARNIAILAAAAGVVTQPANARRPGRPRRRR